MESIYEKINWRELAFDLLDDMYVNYGEKWTAQWLYDEGYELAIINCLLGSDYSADELTWEEK